MRKGFGQIWRFVKPRGLSLVMLFGFSWPSVSQEARCIPINTEISNVYGGNMEQALSHVVLNLGMPDSTRLTQEGFTVLNPRRRDSGLLAGLVTRLSFVEQHSNAVSRPFGFRKLELGFFKFKDQARQMIKYLDVSCGLPSNLIYDVYESSTGEIWIAYAGGVAKLTSSVLYVSDPKAGFPDFPVTSIQEFGSSMLLGTFGGGLIQINGASFKMHNESSGFCTNLILDMAVCDSVLYIGTYGEGLLATGLNGETKKIVAAALEEHDVVQSLAVHADTLYFIHKNGYAFLKDETLTVFDVSQGLPEDRYAAIEVDESGKIWLAGETQGLVSIQNSQVTTYPELNQATGPISIMYAGRSGNVWIGSANNGLFMVMPQGYLPFGSKDGLSSENISSLRQDQFDNLWIGTNDGGVNIFIPSNFRLSDMPGSVSNLTRGEKDAVLGVYDNDAVLVYTDTAIFNVSHPELSGITDVIYDSVRQCTWISTHRGLFRLRAEGLEKIVFSDGVSNISNHLSLMLDRQNALWICDYNFGVIKYMDESFFNYPDWSKNRNTLAIHTVQATNKIWASTSLGQISAFEGDSITEYFVTSNDIPVKFFGSCVIGDTVMFISNVGLILETGNTFFQVKMDGLDDDELFNSIVYEPSSARLYVTTNSEIRALTVKGEHQVYHTHHDLIPVAFSKESGLTSPESNSVYFGTNRGVLQYVPFEFRNHAIRRKIVVEEFLIKSEEGNFTDLSHALDKVTLDSMRNSVPFGLTIPLEFNTIRLRFSCMDWGKETGTTYKYSLDGGTWSAFKSELDLANLKSGRHVLNVRAFLSGNLESDDLVIRFEIVAPFYMRAWFVFAVLLVFIFGVWMMIRRFSSLNFDSFKSNTEIAFLLKKARVLALAAILLFFVIDLYHSRVNSDYTVNWYVNSLICLVALGIIVYTYLPHPRQRFVYNGLVYSFLFISLITIFRTALNNFEPVLCIESALVLLFSIFIFAEIKNIFVYCSTMFLTALTATFFVDANPDHETLFLSAVGQVILAVSLFGILERNNLSRILFAHKLLQFSRQYVLVANKNAEIVYVSKYMLTALGINEQDVIGLAWWNYCGRGPEEMVSIRYDLLRLLDSGTIMNYVNKVENRLTGEYIYVEWQDAPIEGTYVLSIGNDITEKVKQQEQLERLSLVAKNVINGVVITNENNHIEWVNDSFLKLMEYQMDELVGKVPVELFSGPATSDSARQKVLSPELNDGVEILQYTKTGKPLWFLINVTRILDDSQKLVKKVSIITDITRELHTRNRAAFVLNNSGDIIYTCDMNGCFDYLNAAVEDVLGYEITDLLGQHYSSVIPEEQREVAVEFYSNLVDRNLSNTKYDLRVLRRDGQEIWLSQTVNFIKSDTGAVVGFLAIAKDVTDSKKEAFRKQMLVEEQVNLSNILRELSVTKVDELDDFLCFVCKKLALALNVGMVNIWVNDADSISRRYTREGLFRDQKQRVIKSDAAIFFEQLDAGRLISIDDTDQAGFLPDLMDNYISAQNIGSILAAPIRSGESIWGIVSFETSAEKRIWSDQQKVFIKSLAEIVSTAIQMDLRKKAELKIHESESNFRLLNETIDDVFWLMDIVSKKVIYISPSSKKVLGVYPEEFYQTDNYWKNYVLDDDKPKIQEAHKRIESEGFYEIEYRIQVEGAIRWISEKSFGISDTDGKLVKSSGICSDITDRKKKEEIIEKQNNDIRSSISYAQRIQMALLPDKSMLQVPGIDSAIFYRSKDIIGGDFYWFDQVGDTLVIAVGDCTGHGVPGALMTSLGINGLINAVNELRLTDPAEILTYLDTYILRVLSTGNPDDQVQDGMDISILTINLKSRAIYFGSAARPLIIVEDGAYTRYDGNRKSIGSNTLAEHYRTLRIEHHKDMRIFLFSDGMVDQFGGPRNRRLGSKIFYEFCASLSDDAPAAMLKKLNGFYGDWAKFNSQTDDMICVMLKIE